MTAQDIIFRCSSLGHLMTEPKNKSEKISETTKRHLIDVYASSVYGRREDVTNKFIDKGNTREEDSLTLLALQMRTMFKKNSTRLSNEFITGEPDAFIGRSIKEADQTFDTKTSWSLHTFLRAKFAKPDTMYYYQGMGYMWLTGAKKHTVVYCLVNSTAQAILDEKRRAAWHVGEDSGSRYAAKCRQIEVNHIFDLAAFRKENPDFIFDNDVTRWVYDIPAKGRIFAYSFERSDAEIVILKNKIDLCREYMEKELFELKTEPANDTTIN